MLSRLTPNQTAFSNNEGGIVALRQLFPSLLKVAKKIDPISVIAWNPSKSVSFVLKAISVFRDNKKVFKVQSETLQNILALNPIYMEAAHIAQDVYLPQGKTIQGGWNRSEDFDDLRLCDVETGLVSHVYKRTINGNTEYIYATAGTNPKNIQDWKNNLDQLYGNSRQYQQSCIIAQELAKRIKAAGNASLLFVGHSLGGGIATNNALHTGYEAIAFNPAGLSTETIADVQYIEEQQNKLVTMFVATNDILNWLQDTSQCFEGMKQVVPASIGQRYYLSASMVSPLKSHSIEQMIQNMMMLKGTNSILYKDNEL